MRRCIGSNHRVGFIRVRLCPALVALGLPAAKRGSAGHGPLGTNAGLSALQGPREAEAFQLMIQSYSCDPVNNPRPTSLVYGFLIMTMATQPSANFVRRPTGLGEATTNTSSDKGPINGTDSGYGSLDSTPDGKSCEDGKFELKHRFSRQLFRRFKKTKLRPFDQEISQAVQNRFSDLTELFGSSLYSFLIKRRVKYNAISIKLKVLGKDERSAKPWVVVQCDEAASKPIKDFFDQPAVKSQYRPGGSEPDLPSFDVVVHPRAPVSLAAPHQVSVYDNSLTDFDTLCGKIIRIGSLDKPHIATLGGLIMIEKSWGEFMLKGLTAGHILTQESITGHNNGRESPSTYIYTGHSSCETGPIQLKPGNQKDEDGLMHNGDHPQEQEYSADGEMAPEFELDEEDIEIDLAVKIGKATKGTTSFQDSSLDITTQDNQLEEYWSKIGSIYSTSRDKESGPDQDWALVNIDPYLYRPNLLADKPSGANMPELTKLSGELDNSEGSRAVILLSGIGGPKRGMLSLSPSFLMMGHAKSFTKTYNLLLHHDPGIINPRFRIVHMFG